MAKKAEVETSQKEVQKVDKEAFIQRKLAALNSKAGAKNERSAVRVINNNRGGTK